jgi:2-deoxy-D-gluconate 3-dehydrogenase
LKATELFQLAGKIALVTGAARGIGQAIAVGLAEAGADVVLIDRMTCSETVQQIEALGKRVIVEQRDLSKMDGEKAQEILSSGVAHFGDIDILVNNAGIISRGPALKYSAEDWKAVLDINLNSVFFLSQAVARHFIENDKRGKIINLASVLSFQGGLQVPSYTASKSGLLGLTKALSNEWASQGINVNAIAPGYFKTEVTAGIRSDPQRSAAMLDRIPAGKWGELEDLKGPAVFLASAASDYMHGAVVTIDGGWLAR